MRIVAGEWRGRRIEAPAGRATRPTADRVREAWMSAIAADLPGARVVDLFAGSGALGIEALSRGAASAVFVERGPAALRVLRANLERLDAGARARVVAADAIGYAERLEPHTFDLAFADPPYGQGLAAALARIFQQRSFAELLCIEHASDELEADLCRARTRRYGDTRLTFITAPE